jgi:hypothetical protein
MTNFGLRTLGTAIALVMLAGCGGSLQPGAPSNQLIPHAARSWPHASHVDPALRGKDLLYVSSVYTCDVDVFTYPQGKLVQTISACGLGFGPAFGLCSDKNGNVFMTMGEGFSVFEFPHGGTEPIEQLENDFLLPLGCSVNPMTGDLAVASEEANVAVYKNASGTPQVYYLSNVSEFFYCTYDDHGNLFVGAENYDRGFTLAELRSGGTALRAIKVPGGIAPGYAVQWDGRHLAVGASQSSNEFTIDRLRISGNAAKLAGSTTLSAPPNSFDELQFWIQGGKIVQPESNNAEVGLWKYPRGGEQIKGISMSGSTFVGVTVSVALP